MDDLVVFVRIGLYVLAGRLVAGGWLPEELAAEFTSPMMIEAVVGVLSGLGVGSWYWFSKARKSLIGANQTS